MSLIYRRYRTIDSGLPCITSTDFLLQHLAVIRLGLCELPIYYLFAMSEGFFLQFLADSYVWWHIARLRIRKCHGYFGWVQMLVLDGARGDYRLNCERRGYRIVRIFSLCYSVLGGTYTGWCTPTYCISRIKLRWSRHWNMFRKW